MTVALFEPSSPFPSRQRPHLRLVTNARPSIESMMEPLFTLPIEDPAPRDKPCPRLPEPRHRHRRATLREQYAPFTNPEDEREEIPPIRYVRAYDAFTELALATRAATRSLFTPRSSGKLTPRAAWAVPLPDVPSHDHAVHIPCVTCAVSDPRRRRDPRATPTTMRNQSRLAGPTLVALIETTRDMEWFASTETTAKEAYRFLHDKVTPSVEVRMRAVFGENWTDVWAIARAVEEYPVEYIHAAVIASVSGHIDGDITDTEGADKARSTVRALSSRMFAQSDSRNDSLTAADGYIGKNVPAAPAVTRHTLASQWLLACAWGGTGLSVNTSLYTWLERMIGHVCLGDKPHVHGLDA